MKYFLIFSFIWWIVFFMILPIGIVVKKNIKIGNADSAPIKPRILIKFAATTIISGIVVLLVFLAVHHGYIDKQYLT